MDTAVQSTSGDGSSSDKNSKSKSIGWAKLKKLFKEDREELLARIQMKSVKSRKGIILIAQHISEHRWDLIQNWFQMKYDVSEAVDGHSVTSMLDNGYDVDYRALVLEVDLPFMNGIAVIEYLRNMYKSNIPIIVVSHNDDFNELQNCLEFGANTFLRKPYTKEQFQNIIDKLDIGTDLPKDESSKPIHDMAGAVKRLLQVGIGV
tara:strand:- start:920 stop:1534 length:615 start_codon:yes stop_codon:yes gene_type:complete